MDASRDFLLRTLRRLGGHLLALFSDFEQGFGPIEKLRAVPRGTPNRARNEVGMDAQVIVNSLPLVDGTTVRGPHLDWPDKLISALLYLRPEDDDSVGGDLELYAPVDGALLFDAYNEVPLDKVRHVAHLPLSPQPDDPAARHAPWSPWRQSARADVAATLLLACGWELAGALFEIPRQTKSDDSAVTPSRA